MRHDVISPKFSIDINAKFWRKIGSVENEVHDGAMMAWKRLRPSASAAIVHVNDGCQTEVAFLHADIIHVYVDSVNYTSVFVYWQS